jgi:hypothetical protein
LDHTVRIPYNIKLSNEIPPEMMNLTPHFSHVQEGYAVYESLCKTLKHKKKGATVRALVSNFRKVAGTTSNCMVGCGMTLKLLTCCFCGDACLGGGELSERTVRELQRFQEHILPLYRDVDDKTLTDNVLEVWDLLHTLAKLNTTLLMVVDPRLLSMYSMEERVGKVLDGIWHNKLVLEDANDAAKVRRYAPMFCMISNYMTMDTAAALARGETVQV